MNYGLNLGYALSFILVGLFASCLLSTYLNLSQVTITSISSDDTFAGSPVEYKIAVKENRGKTRYSIELHAMGACSRLDLTAKQSATATIRSRDTLRGIHKIGRITISSDFPLGLWRGWGYIHAPTSTFIYPSPETPVSTLPLGSNLTPYNHTYSAEEREFEQLKRYESTDSLSTVAWKTVASGRGWFTKDFISAGGNSELELSWSSTVDLHSEEKRLSRLCAWVLQAEKLAAPYRLTLPDYSTPTALGHQHKRNCLRHLSSIESHD